jgi:hypothetical protein
MNRRVWIGLVVACAGVGGWVIWSRSQPVIAGDTSRSMQPFVQLAGAGTDVGDQLLRERAELMDPTPLFFPTEWNYGHQPLNEGNLKDPGEFFGSFLPKPTIDEQKIASYGAEAPIVPEKLSDVLVQGNEAPFAGIGQVDGRQSSLPIRAGYLEVGDLQNGDTIISHSLSGLLLPRTDFDPVEFIVVVGAGGLIGEPFLTNGSGWEEVDTFFRSYLVKSYRLGERLRPGRYRVVLGS